MNELQGKAVGGVVPVYFNAQLYIVKVVKKYRFVYKPCEQGGMLEVHYSFWHGDGVCQFIPLRWNGNCGCYQQVNSTFELCYD